MAWTKWWTRLGRLADIVQVSAPAAIGVAALAAIFGYLGTYVSRFDPALLVVLAACLVGSFVWTALGVVVLWRTIRGRHQRESDKSPQAGLRVLARGQDSAIVVLSEREFDLGPGAIEYYENSTVERQEKLVRLLRRSFLKRRFSRDEFIVEVDDTQRWHIRLNEFIGRGRRLTDAIEAEVSSRALRPPPRIRGLADLALALEPPSGLLMGLPDFKLQQLGSDVQSWQDDIYKFLQTERAGYAEEFVRPIDPSTHDLDQLALLLHKTKALIERVVEIKNAWQVP